MPQVDFKLALGIFGDSGLRRDILRLAVVVDIVQEMLDFPEVVRMVDLRARLQTPDAGYMWPGHRRFVGFCVQQVKFELCCHDHPEAHFLKRLHGTLQHSARVREHRHARLLIKPEQCLAHRPFRPGYGRNAAWHQFCENIGIPVVLPKGNACDGLPERGEQGRAAAEPEALFADFLEVFFANALALQKGIEVWNQQFHRVKLAALALTTADLTQ